MRCRIVLLLSKVVVFVFVRERRGLHLDTCNKLCYPGLHFPSTVIILQFFFSINIMEPHYFRLVATLNEVVPTSCHSSVAALTAQASRLDSFPMTVVFAFLYSCFETLFSASFAVQV